MKLQDLKKLEHFPSDPAFEELIQEKPFQLDVINVWYDLHESGIFEKLEGVELKSEEIKQILTDPELREFLLRVDHWLNSYEDDPAQIEFLAFLEDVDFQYNTKLHEYLSLILGWEDWVWEHYKSNAELFSELNTLFKDAGFPFQFPLDSSPFPFNMTRVL